MVDNKEFEIKEDAGFKDNILQKENSKFEITTQILTKIVWKKDPVNDEEETQRINFENIIQGIANIINNDLAQIIFMALNEQKEKKAIINANAN